MANEARSLSPVIIQPIILFPEKGLIFTAQNTMGSSAALWHLPMMPAYEDLPETVMTLPFQDPYLQFYSVDVDYRKKIAYIYEKHYRLLCVPKQNVMLC